MNIASKRDELSKWISSVDEGILAKIDEIKKSTSNEVIIYTSEGKGLTKKEYKSHLDNISKKIDKDSKTYNTEEVRDYVLNRR